MNKRYKIPITIPHLGDEEKKAVSEVIDSGWVSQGPKVAAFEQAFANYVGVRYAVATSSCTTALHSALSVSGIEPGDEVIVPSLSFIATANAVIYCGATPVFADIDPATCNIDAEKIEALVTKRTRAVMPVHQMGLPANLDRIRETAEKYNLLIVEDAACAIGSQYRGRKIGGHGNIACFSLHPRKIITAGEGGMITTNDSVLASGLRRFRHHGMSVSDIERHAADKIIIETYPEIGYNYRMTDLQAAMGIEQLKKLQFIIEKRRQIAGVYDRELSRIPHVRVPRIPDYAYHNYQSYWIELLHSSPLKRNALMTGLLEKGIATRRGIMAIHLEESYSGYEVPLPWTERMTENTVLLPIYPDLSADEQEYIIQCMKELIG